MTARRGRAAAALGVFGLLVLTLSAVAGSSAGASVTARAHQATATSGRRFVARHLQVQPARIAGTTAARPLAVVPPVTSPPACYGDSRNIHPVTGALDPASYGAFFSSPTTVCSPTVTTPPGAQPPRWTFEVQTQDSWSPSSFGAWTVLINTDGLPDNCQGWNYFAQFSQLPPPHAPGAFQAVFGPLSPSSNCGFVGTQTATGSVTGTTASISIPASAIGNSPTLTWNGTLQSLAEETQGGGDAVPCGGNPLCGGLAADGQVLQGAVAEALPATTPASCATNPSTTQVVTLLSPSTVQDSNAVTALTNEPGLTNVRNYDPPPPANPDPAGVISFSGDTTSAQTALATAGIPYLQIDPAQVYAPQAIVSAGVSSTVVGSQWNLGAIGSTGAQSVTKGNGVVVADIDTGLDYLDPNLGTNPLPGFDESTAVNMGPGPATPVIPEVGNTDTLPTDAGAGTATAGVIASVASATAIANHTRLTSLGFNTHVLPVKVNFDDAAASAEIDAGIRWAADHSAHIINLPFAGVCPDPNLLSAINYAQGKGDLVVAAAGDGALNPNLDQNNGTNNAPAYPAAYATAAPPSTPAGQASVVAVGATGGDGIRASYSDTGSYVSMVAPGGSAIPADSADDLALLAPGDQCPGEPCYTTGAGTGLAAAQASAEAALVWAANPNLTASQTRELLTSTTTDQGVSGTDVEYGTGLENASVALADTPPATPGYGTFFSVSPFRLLDTRTGTGEPAGAAKLGPGIPLPVTVTGVPGSSVPATGVTAVVLNVTVTDATAGSFLTVWPDGQARPNSSNINFTAGMTLPNLVTVKVNPANGRIDLFNAGGSVDVIADIGGYYVDGSGSVGSTFVPVSPVRLLDTRSCSSGAPGCPAPGPIGTKVSRTLPITSPTGIVPDTATGVVLNVTVTGPTAGSFLTVYPANLSSPPNASNLNFGPRQTIPNLVSAQLGLVGAGPTEGVKVYNAGGNVHVIVDLEGYFTAAGDTTGARFFPLVSHRILDTRANIGNVSTPIGAANDPVAIAIVGQGGVLDGGSAVVMNTTVTSPTAGSFLTVYPSARPTASNLNFSAGQTIANLVSVAINPATGQDDFYNAGGTVQVIADVAGWYGPLGH